MGLIATLAIVYGKFIAIFSFMPLRWMVSFGLAITILFFGFVSKSPKRFFLFMLCLSLPIASRNFIGACTRVNFSGPPGFYTDFRDFPLAILYVFCISNVFIMKREKLRFSSFDWCFLALLLACILSIYNSRDFTLSLFMMFRLAVTYAMFYYMANFVSNISEVRTIIIALLLGAALECSLAFLQFIHGGTLGLGLLGEAQELLVYSGETMKSLRIAGTLRHPNAFSTYLGFIIPLGTMMLLCPIRKAYKAICITVVGMSLMALVLTLSRGGWLSLAVAMIVIMAGCLKAKMIKARALFPITMKVGLALFLLTAVFQGVLRDRLIHDDYDAAMTRVPLMQVATEIISSHPFIGIGINNYTEVHQEYDKTPERITSHIPNPVHNSYMLILAETGIVGIASFLIFVVLICSAGRKIILRSVEERFIACVAIGVLGGMTAFLVHILFEPMNLDTPAFAFFWLESGFLIALLRISKRTATTKETSMKFNSSTPLALDENHISGKKILHGSRLTSSSQV
ncbi:O-antigen ligase family protein [Candidatus Hydrogenedentota bacterium]